jgi:hypothetical protein
MVEDTNILSLTFNFTVQDVETTDEDDNSTTEEWYTISCGDSICWRLIGDKAGNEEEQTFIQLQVAHVLNHLRERLEHRARTLGEESYFIAGKQMALTGAKERGQKFFKQRVRSDEARAKRLLSVRRGQPRRLTKAEQAKLPARYDALHEKFTEIKKRHNAEREKDGNRELNYEDWPRQWLLIAKNYYPKDRREYLELIADPDDYISSPSMIAYLALAKETGYTPQYLQKLVPRARKAGQSD